jgi:hypothetical protein
MQAAADSIPGAGSSSGLSIDFSQATREGQLVWGDYVTHFYNGSHRNHRNCILLMNFIFYFYLSSSYQNTYFVDSNSHIFWHCSITKDEVCLISIGMSFCARWFSYFLSVTYKGWSLPLSWAFLRFINIKCLQIFIKFFQENLT